MAILEYQASQVPTFEAIAELYAAAHLPRPTSDPERLEGMFKGSNVLLTCWDAEPDEPRLAGLLRGWTDYSHDGYVCDLAVHPDYRGHGIAKSLLERVKSIGVPNVQWALLASAIAPAHLAELDWEGVTDTWISRPEAFQPPRPGSGP